MLTQSWNDCTKYKLPVKHVCIHTGCRTTLRNEQVHTIKIYVCFEARVNRPAPLLNCNFTINQWPNISLQHETNSPIGKHLKQTNNNTVKKRKCDNKTKYKKDTQQTEWQCECQVPSALPMQQLTSLAHYWNPNVINCNLYPMTEGSLAQRLRW